jgi:PilZ domain
MREYQRAIVRKRTQQLVYLELGRDNGGVMLNLTEQGCGFQAITAVNLGETTFAFQISGGRRISGDGVVVWKDQGGVTGGLKFTNLSLEARKQIRQWLEEVGAPEDPGSAVMATSAPDETLPRQMQRTPEPELAEVAVPARQPRQTPWAESRAAAEQTPPPMVPPAGAPEQVASAAPAFNAWAEYASRNALPRLEDGAQWPSLREEITYGNPSEAKSARFWRGVALVTTLAALAAVLAIYQRDVGRSLIWLGETINGRKAPQVVPEAKADSSPVAAPGAASEPAKQESDMTPKTDAETTAAKEIVGVRDKQPAVSQPQSMLEQQGAPAKNEKWNGDDSVESLWEGVQSGSISAEMSLAERFAHGEGVEKNCDQAKVLMKAAANRGSKEARVRLYELESGACE